MESLIFHIFRLYAFPTIPPHKKIKYLDNLLCKVINVKFTMYAFICFSTCMQRREYKLRCGARAAYNRANVNIYCGWGSPAHHKAETNQTSKTIKAYLFVLCEHQKERWFEYAPRCVCVCAGAGFVESYAKSRQRLNVIIIIIWNGSICGGGWCGGQSVRKLCRPHHLSNFQ